MLIRLMDNTVYSFNKKEFIDYMHKFYCNGYSKKEIKKAITSNEFTQDYYVDFFNYQGRDLPLKLFRNFNNGYILNNLENEDSTKYPIII